MKRFLPFIIFFAASTLPLAALPYAGASLLSAGAPLSFAGAALPYATQAPASSKTPQQSYIEQFAPLAVSEMYRSGVPASITLAQGILESNSGRSSLSAKGNNHFGIKCHNWNGRKMYHDDDAKGECFRVYDSPEESFRDHSDFLRYRDRYKFLFDLDPLDYKGWAYGLKKAGYATDPAYPKKLIKLIEDYGLDEYDKKPSSWARKADSKKKDSKKDSKKQQEAEQQRPESPNKIEQAKPFDEKQRSTFHLPLSRNMMSLNGVPFIYASAGETYKSIAKANGLFLKELLKFNDLKEDEILYPGTIVYLQAKKKQAAKGLDKYIVEGDDESLYEIAQRFGVRMSSLCKMNGLTPDKRLFDGEVIKLRK